MHAALSYLYPLSRGNVAHRNGDASFQVLFTTTQRSGMKFRSIKGSHIDCRIDVRPHCNSTCNQPPFTHPLSPSHPRLPMVESGKRICMAPAGMLMEMLVELPVAEAAVSAPSPPESKDTRAIHVSRRG